MTVLELKAQLQKDIENEQNSSIIEKVQAYYRKLKAAPCQFTAEEKEAILLKGEQDAKNGLGTSHEDLEKEFATW